MNWVRRLLRSAHDDLALKILLAGAVSGMVLIIAYPSAINFGAEGLVVVFAIMKSLSALRDGDDVSRVTSGEERGLPGDGGVQRD